MIIRLACAAMGTRFELALAGESEVELHAIAEEALAEIHDCEQRLSPYRQDSLLSHVHRCAAKDWVRLDVDSYALFDCSKRICSESDGVFDPSVAPRDPARAQDSGGSMRDVELDPEQTAVLLRKAGLRFDFGAIAKGQALDLAASVLREAGIQTAILHGGTSSSLAIGAPEASPGFRIAVPGGATKKLRNQAMALSSVRSPRDASQEPHLIDPNTGLPPTDANIAMVIGDSAMESDAWATVLAIRPQLAERLPQGMRSELWKTNPEATCQAAAENS
ncbi:MAG: hypothetical protein CSA62_01940 [Planctomycetota bacterium]|nr:MAG: hypothetical protein CSA62_01940 [Planctomycetota bacterium]